MMRIEALPAGLVELHINLGVPRENSSNISTDLADSERMQRLQGDEWVGCRLR